jgi:hypothetical protein
MVDLRRVEGLEGYSGMFATKKNGPVDRCGTS